MVEVTPPAFALDDAAAPVIALPVSLGPDGPVLGPDAEDLDAAHDLLGHLEIAKATGRAGETTTVAVTARSPLTRILLIGVGEGSADDFRRAGAAFARALRSPGDAVERVATTIPAADPDVALAPFVAGATLGSFLYTHHSTPPWLPVRTVALRGLDASLQPALDRAVAVARASWLARTLATVPSNVKNPAWLADQAKAVAKASGLKAKVWDEKALAREGFGGILAVGGGSATPPRLIRLDYTPKGATAATPTLALVGKGITFDSGGLNIKPGDGMKTMKRDMTGGGVVIATMSALAAVGCPVKVVGLVPAAENAVSGSSFRPGDVVRHFSGRTSEIGNTDAEGRVVLADALGYAVREVGPDAIVDVATLTGAIKVTLGQTLAGLFANRDALADRLLAAGLASGERLWRMPLAEVYEDRIASKIADATNDSGTPGAITAALYLQHFVEGEKGAPPWAHLDIASVGDARKDEWEWTEGPTGFGARLLLEWLGASAPLDGLA